MLPQRTLLLANPNAGGAAVLEEIESRVAVREGWTLVEPASVDEFLHHVRTTDAELLVVAGGDGTVHGAVSALADRGAQAPALGIIPLGTGNDLARTLGVPEDPALALEALDAPDVRALDLIAVEGGRWVINVASAGIAVTITESLDGELKERWGPAAYALSAASNLAPAALESWELEIAVDDGQGEPVEAVAVFVANGRTCGGGLAVAPSADPEDGIIEVLVVPPAPAASLAALFGRMRLGTVEEHEGIRRWRGRAVRVGAAPTLSWSLDGEVSGDTHRTFSVHAGALRVAVGPDYVRDPAFPDEVP